MAARGARAAAGDAGDRVSRRRVAGAMGASHAAFRQGLAEAGFVEGQNVAIEYRWAHGHNDRLPALVADLVGRPVIVIAAPAHAGDAGPRQRPRRSRSSSASAKTRCIGLVATLARPGGNLTGVATLGLEIAP